MTENNTVIDSLEKPHVSYQNSAEPTVDANATANATTDTGAWQALGYYAIGELSIGRVENALYAYRLLTALEENEVRWKLGRAFCALELGLVADASETLGSVDVYRAQLEHSSHKKLFERCQLRLEHMQAQLQKPQASISVVEKDNITNDDRKISDWDGKVIPFPNANKV